MCFTSKQAQALHRLKVNNGHFPIVLKAYALLDEKKNSSGSAF